MRFPGKKVAVLLESDFYEKEIFYYEHRFPEADMELHFLTRLWGQTGITFRGHEEHYPFFCNESFEGLSDDELDSYSIVIVPSGMVADRLRYTEQHDEPPPAAVFLKRVFARPNILKGIICHGLWLTAPFPELVRGRRLTCHANLIGDARAYGAEFINEDVVVDRDLITARTGAHCHLFVRTLLEELSRRKE